MEINELVAAHTAGFNEAVASGDFSDMVRWFAPDAEMVFEGVPVGPFQGRDAIAAAYTSQPPDDEMRVLEVLSSTPDSIEVAYAWSVAPDHRAGTMTLERNGDSITRLVVRFE